MLGIRHKRVNLYLSLVARPSRIYRDVSILIVVKCTEIVLRHSSAQVDFILIYSENDNEIRVFF